MNRNASVRMFTVLILNLAGNGDRVGSFNVKWVFRETELSLINGEIDKLLKRDDLLYVEPRKV